MMFGKMFLRAVAVAVVAGVVASAATAAEPGTTPLEQAAGAAASEIAGKAVQVRCHDQTSWTALTSENGVRPTAYGLARVNGTIAELAPSICSALDDLWAGSPLACTEAISVTVRVKVWVWTTVRKRVRVKVAGAWVYRLRPVRVRKRVERTKTQTRGVPAACVADVDRARAVHTLAHETMHLAGHEDELVTHCRGLQQVAALHERLTGESGRQAAGLAWIDYRDSLLVRAYYSAECRQDGPLDLTPGDGIWP